MAIYASDWKGSGTEQNPLIPSAVTNPAMPWRAAEFPECVFTNTFDSAPAAEEAPAGKIILVAPDIDTVVGATVRQQLQAQFKFTVLPGETLRQTAARRGVNFLPGKGVEF